MRLRSLLASLSLTLVANCAALACDCLPPRPLDQAMREAVAVFRAAAVSVVNEPLGMSPTDKYANQFASMKIVEVFKGRYTVGDVVTIHQSVGPGLCGVSVRNEPPFFGVLDANGNLETPRKLRGEWIIYAYGVEPFEVSNCSRSTPMEFGAKELSGLRRLKSVTATPNKSLDRTLDR